MAAATPAEDKTANCRARRGTAAGRSHKIGAGRIEPRRLLDRRCRWPLECGLTALAGALQPLRGNQFDTKLASLDALDAIKLKSSRVCPLICDHGYKADGDHCSRITCAEGSFLNDDNECEKRRGKKPVATRNRPERVALPKQGEFRSQQREFISRALRDGIRASGANGRPLTGLERQQGCTGYASIMSGVCP